MRTTWMLVAVPLALLTTTATATAHSTAPGIVPPPMMVLVGDASYSPAAATPKAWQGVVWNFNQVTPRSVTDTTGLGLYNSGLRDSSSASKAFEYGFQAAAHYTYDSSNYPTQKGVVDVPIIRSRDTGSTATTFTFTWAYGSHPGFAYDLEIKLPGATTWEWWRYGETVDSGTFRASHAGTYQFRARLRRVSTNKVTAFSPVAPVIVS